MEARNDWTIFIENLKSRLDIVDVISGYTSVERRGSSFWACCPFHHEKTPSFSINQQGQFYHCFGGGCGAHGDSIKFVMDFESVDFMSAVEILAKKAGLEVPRGISDKESKEIKKKKTAQLSACLDTAKFYSQVLRGDFGEIGQSYLKKRGVSKEIAAKFGIGLSPDFSSLPQILSNNGHSLETAFEAGVINKKDNRYFDALGCRLIIPIINSMGEVIAFGGRSFETKPEMGKYINTKQTFLFNKSRNLFAINLVKKKKQESSVEYVIVTEGYMDVIALHQAGFDTAVASMGTSLTKDQARLIKRYCDKVYICYDGDSAGKQATMRGLDILQSESLEVRVVEMPSDTDPDEFILKYGAEAYKELLGTALPLTDYKLSQAKKQCGLSDEKSSQTEETRRQYAVAGLNVIRSLDSLVEKESYLKTLSNETGYSLDWLMREIMQAAPTQVVKIETTSTNKIAQNSTEKAKYFVLACMLNDLDFVDKEFFPDCENDEFFAKSFGYIEECITDNAKIIASMLYNLFNGEYSDKIDYALNQLLDKTIDNIKCYNDSVSIIKKHELNVQIAALNDMYDKEKDLSKQAEILKQIALLTSKKMNLDKNK